MKADMRISLQGEQCLWVAWSFSHAHLDTTNQVCSSSSISNLPVGNVLVSVATTSQQSDRYQEFGQRQKGQQVKFLIEWPPMSEAGGLQVGCTKWSASVGKK